MLKGSHRRLHRAWNSIPASV